MLAHEAGIFSKVSHENFAKVWHKCIFQARCAAEGAAFEIADLVLQGDPEACQLLLQHLLKAYHEECFQDVCRIRMGPPVDSTFSGAGDGRDRFLYSEAAFCRILPTLASTLMHRERHR